MDVQELTDRWFDKIKDSHQGPRDSRRVGTDAYTESLLVRGRDLIQEVSELPPADRRVIVSTLLVKLAEVG